MFYPLNYRDIGAVDSCAAAWLQQDQGGIVNAVGLLPAKFVRQRSILDPSTIDFVPSYIILNML